MGVVPENTTFIFLCFEGPDNYSMAGGLGDRINCLTNTLADMGFTVHHIFIGDPEMDGVEFRQDGKLVLHRWCQWISEGHRGGVYDGEQWKLDDYTNSAPIFVVQEIAGPAISQGKLVVILGEEWQTAEAMCCIHDLLNMYYLRMHPEKREKIRASARQTAEQWTWQEVVRRLLCELEHQAQAQGIGLPAWV